MTGSLIKAFLPKPWLLARHRNAGNPRKPMALDNQCSSISSLLFCTTELPWGTCNNWWNTKYCINPYLRKSLPCWNMTARNGTFYKMCTMNQVNVTWPELADPVKEFWEFVSIFTFLINISGMKFYLRFFISFFNLKYNQKFCFFLKREDFCSLLEKVPVFWVTILFQYWLWSTISFQISNNVIQFLMVSFFLFHLVFICEHFVSISFYSQYTFVTFVLFLHFFFSHYFFIFIYREVFFF